MYSESIKEGKSQMHKMWRRFHREEKKPNMRSFRNIMIHIAIHYDKSLRMLNIRLSLYACTRSWQIGNEESTKAKRKIKWKYFLCSLHFYDSTCAGEGAEKCSLSRHRPVYDRRLNVAAIAKNLIFSFRPFFFHRMWKVFCCRRCSKIAKTFLSSGQDKPKSFPLGVERNFSGSFGIVFCWRSWQ